MKKIANLALYLLSGTLLFLACSKDDPAKPTPVEEENTAPVIQAKTFTVMESATEIGTVDASDEDGDQLTFSITVNDNALFAIDNTGKISLAEGRSLDFDAFEGEEPQHTITVQVEDKEDKASAQMTINLTDTNDIAPVFEEEGYSFEAFEDIAQDVVMGTVTGSDPEGAPVTYKITADENELFAIDGNTGEITLAEGKQLDFEAFEGSEPVHNIVVQISDGELTAEVNVAITLLNIPEAHPDDLAAFVTTWETTSEGEHLNAVYIGLNGDVEEQNFTINWGDGTVEDINYPADAIGDGYSIVHQYETAGTYKVAIIGVSAVYLNSDYLLSIDQWGSIEWQSMHRAFSSCKNMVYKAKDVPDLTKVTSLEGMFLGCTSFDGDLSGWNTETITDMETMFLEATSFTGKGLDTWNTQNVTNLAETFSNAEAFDQNLGSWDISNVTGWVMLDGTAMSEENYSNTLIGWATLDEDTGETQIPEEIVLFASDLYVCANTEAEEARDYLIFNKGWEIQDNGAPPCGG